jgi:hypothetical protein
MQTRQIRWPLGWLTLRNAFAPREETKVLLSHASDEAFELTSAYRELVSSDRYLAGTPTRSN